MYKVSDIEDTSNGKIYTVTDSGEGCLVLVSWADGAYGAGKTGYLRSTVESLVRSGRWKVVGDKTSDISITNFGTKADLGMYRPDIETRKVGKVPVHMAIDGFPLALFEVSKVMGWAADVKGYKLHDWRNLPDAGIALSSAGYRHMLENSLQKSQGLSATERVDHESGLIHLAHQAFNILAEMELVLGGKIA
ncbi:hypothetical protein vB_PsyM_KIL4_0123 [Pseudomonas phage vB_PsyM_KIL4]|uniref:dATP/dGTP diphosphohydrolase N-terminal domain-containing protein n=2 Tax=Flaumdravirus TaxID=2560133 RepID=A0A142IF42_9CAUD|nr:hypothetical protein FDI83_gp090 [Pseudomonas phage vB_PsyM_KIL4]AMR57847.1 hypothetical protein vB_PsyM_KIL4_0123 [Pseudomonas phage vB_PsyM_KIL4]AMR58019.1 hypothetical protein vB_PsyM_KIL5_0128 [Pseudomonas phage vB_PsyM_KIL5]